MPRFFYNTAMLLLLVSCTGAPGTGGSSSADRTLNSEPTVLGSSTFEPGVYFGTQFCENTISGSGFFDQETTEDLQSITISQFGLPIFDGEEVHPGQIRQFSDYGGILNGNCQTTSVTVDGGRITIEEDCELDFGDPASDNELETDGNSLTILETAATGIEVYATLNLFGTDDFGNSATLSIDCIAALE